MWQLFGNFDPIADGQLSAPNSALRKSLKSVHMQFCDWASPVRRRHSDLQSRLCFKFGEDVDDESGLPHAAHIMATAAIVIDAQREGTLIDDRAHTPGLPAEMKRVAELKKRWPKAA